MGHSSVARKQLEEHLIGTLEVCEHLHCCCCAAAATESLTPAWFSVSLLSSCAGISAQGYVAPDPKAASASAEGGGSMMMMIIPLLLVLVAIAYKMMETE